MVCIYCTGTTKVTNSRLNKSLNRIWRRRKCKKCLSTFTTIERASEHNAFMISTNNKLLPFSRYKLFLSLYKACGHRHNPIEDAEALTDTIIAKIISTSKGPLVKIELLNKIVSVTLEDFDKIAAVYYNAYHKS